MNMSDARSEILCDMGGCLRHHGWSLWGTFMLTACVLLGPQSVSAQAVYGSIFGTVTDNTGAVVSHATVTITDVSKGTSVSTQSNDTGDYRVAHLIPDTYSVTVDAANFQKSTVPRSVTITDVSKGTSVSTQSNDTGDYRVAHLIPDTYSVTVDAANFQKSTVP